VKFEFIIGLLWIATGLSAFVFPPAMVVLLPIAWLTFAYILLRARHAR
jgi:hypothetical protein